MIAKKDILNLETRSKIYGYIKTHPGIHFSNITSKLDINNYNLDYHLRFLARGGLITSMKEKGYARYFIARAVGNNEKKVLSLLRQKTPRHIIIAIMSCYGLSSKELCQMLNKSPSTMNFHIKKLIENDIIEVCLAGKGFVQRKTHRIIIERDIVGREIVYRLKDANWVEKVIIMYRNSLLDEIEKDLFDNIDNWDNEKIPRRIRTLDYSINTSLEKFFEIFPHPYHV